MSERLTRKESLRLKGYDYRRQGIYFVTVCAAERECLFGEISNDEVIHSPVGEIADEYWRAIPAHFPGVSLDAFVIMPNHLHGIIVIEQQSDVGAQHVVPASGIARPKPGSLSTIIRSFKGATSRIVREKNLISTQDL